MPHMFYCPSYLEIVFVAFFATDFDNVRHELAIAMFPTDEAGFNT